MAIRMAFLFVLAMQGLALGHRRPSGQLPRDRVFSAMQQAPVAPPAVRAGIGALSFANAKSGCAGGTSGIFCTADGGHTWVHRYAGPPAFVDLDLATPHTGWAVAVHALLGTVDAGRHWTRLGEPVQPLRSVDFVTATAGWGIAGGIARTYAGSYQSVWPFSGGTLVRTLDGGRTWRPVLAAGRVDSICFGTSSIGWMAYAATVRLTRDRGRTWRTMASFPLNRRAPWVASIACNGTAVAWVLVSGDDGASDQQPYALFRTDDGGRHWTAVVDEGYFSTVYPTLHPPRSALFGYIGPLSLTGTATVYILGPNFNSAPSGGVQLVRTRDGGRSWGQAVTIPGLDGEGPLVFAFVDALHGWVGGSDGRTAAVLATTDGGQTWTRQL